MKIDGVKVEGLQARRQGWCRHCKTSRFEKHCAVIPRVGICEEAPAVCCFRKNATVDIAVSVITASTVDGVE